MKVQIFEAVNNESYLQGQVNNWFHNNKDIEIVKILQTQSGRLDRHVVISIFYKEKEV